MAAATGSGRRLTIFISSPGDVLAERNAVERVVQRLNAAHAGAVHLEALRWEHRYYTADATFQAQIRRAEDCDLVVAIFWSRLGSELPPAFPKMPDGRPYPSGSAYEILTSLAARAARGAPDVLVYRKTQPVAFSPFESGEEKAARAQLVALNAFWAERFVAPDGRILAAWQGFSSVDAFEPLLETHLTQWLADRRHLARVAAWPIAERGSPFRGLEAFDAAHEELLFGRRREIERGLRLVQQGLGRDAAFLLLVGSSGAGKSSLARAGLAPKVARLAGDGGADVWRIAAVKPETPARAFDNLAEALFAALPELGRSDFHEPQALAALFAGPPEAAARPIARALERAGADFAAREGLHRPARARLVLVLDQLEDLFAGGADAEPLARLVARLVAGGAVVVATLRSDAYEAFAAAPGWRALKEAGASLDVAAPGAADLAAIVEEPARLAGLVFGRDAETGRPLDDLLAEAARGSDALPLLQFTLRRLYEAMVARLQARGVALAAAEPADLVLEAADYHALGGLDGGLDRAAETAFAALDAPAQAALPRLLRALARVDGPSALLRTAARAAAAPDEHGGRLADALVAARILVAGAEDGRPTLRFAHEAALRGWRRVAALIEAERGFFRIREEVGAARARHEAAIARGDDGADFLIPPGVPLAEAEEIRRAFGAELDAGTLAYIDRSSARARRRLTRLRAVAASFALLAALAAGLALVAFRQTNVAEARAREAAERLRQSLLDQSRLLAGVSERASDAGDFARAALLALEALPSDASPRPYWAPAEAALHRALVQLRELRDLRGPGARVNGLAFAPDGETLVVGDDKGARLFDLRAEAAPIALGESEPVNAVAFAPDGRRVAVAADSGARVFDSATRRPLFSLDGHTARVTSVAYSGDGRTIVTGSDDQSARLFDASTGRPLHVLGGHEFRVLAVALNDDGSLALTGSSDSKARLFDARGGALIAEMAHGGPVNGVAFSRDGAAIATVSDDRLARLWDAGKLRARDNEPAAQLPDLGAAALSVAFAADGERLAVGLDDGSARIFSLLTGKRLAILRGGAGRVAALAFSRDDARLASASGDGAARLWDARTDRHPLTLRGRGSMRAGAYDPKGERVVTASGDGLARLWRVADGALLARLEGHREKLWSIAFSPDGARVVTASYDRTARIFDSAGAAAPLALEGHAGAVLSATFSADGRRVATASEDGTARIWSATDGRELLRLAHASGRVLAARFSPDGKILASAGDDRMLRLWDATTGAPLAALAGHAGRILSIAFSADGTRLASGSDDSTARLWSIASRREIAKLVHGDTVNSVAFRPDGARLVTASDDRTARIFDGHTGQELVVLRGHADYVQGAEFSADGRRVVTASFDRTARLWSAEGGPPIAVFAPHDDFVAAAASRPDGRQALTISNDGAARLWPIYPTTADLIAAAKRALPRCLSAAEREIANLGPDSRAADDPRYCLRQ